MKAKLSSHPRPPHTHTHLEKKKSRLIKLLSKLQIGKTNRKTKTSSFQANKRHLQNTIKQNTQWFSWEWLNFFFPSTKIRNKTRVLIFISIHSFTGGFISVIKEIKDFKWIRKKYNCFKFTFDKLMYVENLMDSTK